jgi:hypothetical protein
VRIIVSLGKSGFYASSISPIVIIHTLIFDKARNVISLCFVGRHAPARIDKNGAQQ